MIDQKDSKSTAASKTIISNLFLLYVQGNSYDRSKNDELNMSILYYFYSNFSHCMIRVTPIIYPKDFNSIKTSDTIISNLIPL